MAGNFFWNLMAGRFEAPVAARMDKYLFGKPWLGTSWCLLVKSFGNTFKVVFKISKYPYFSSYRGSCWFSIAQHCFVIAFKRNVSWDFLKSPNLIHMGLRKCLGYIYTVAFDDCIHTFLHFDKTFMPWNKVCFT